MTYITADEVERERANTNATVLPGNSGVDNGIQANPGKHPEFARSPRFARRCSWRSTASPSSTTIYGGAANIVPCLYGLPNLTGSVTPTPTTRPRPRRWSMAPASTSPRWVSCTFDTYYADPLSANVMTAIADNWKTNLGLTVKPLPLENVRLAEATTTRTATATSRSGARPTARPVTAATTTSTRRRVPDRQQRRKGHSYSNPEVDKLLEDARVEFDQAKQDAIYQQVCQITKDDLPNLYLWQSVRFHVVSKKAQNVIVIPAAGGGSYYDAAELWTVTE